MASFLDRLLQLWTEPLGDDAAERFGTLYADPVRVNGAPLSVADMVARARALQAAYSDVEFEVVDQLETTDKVVVGFRMRGRHTGPLATPIGTVEPTGKVVENRVTDILTRTDGRVTDIWVVADDLGALVQLDAVRLAP
jgi:predicted ester cyclase